MNASRIPTSRLLVPALAFALLGCPGGAPAPPPRRPVGSPANFVFPKGEKIPGYEGLAPGRAFVYDLLLGSRRMDVVKTLGESEVVLERHVNLGGQEQDVREVREPTVSTGEPFRPGGLELGVAWKKVAEETITVSGQVFECDVYEARGAGQTARHWIAPRFPFIVRSSSNEIRSLDLKQILDHPPAPAVPLPPARPAPASSAAPETEGK